MNNARTLNSTTGVVVIGRNEGARLVACLNSLRVEAERIVYVDSGSTDQSIQEAARRSIDVVQLDMSQPFTAARARNEGWRALLHKHPDIAFVQFVDGDCEVDASWLDVAADFLTSSPRHAIACGRRREKFPQASVYNHLCDLEWNTPIGDAKACGGDALFRAEVLMQTEGFKPDLIAGEEPELCVRVRRAGWLIRRLDHEMTRHDAAMHGFHQWWQRSKRAGYAYAAGFALHGHSPERHWAKETIRAVSWGIVLPLATILAGTLIAPWAFLALLTYPLQVARIYLKTKDRSLALYTVLGKFAEASGVVKYMLDGDSKLIEYKNA